jgi:low temperature requirement protein LtrA
MNMDKKNIAMIAIWLIIFLGMVVLLVSMIPVMNFNSTFSIFGILFAICYLGISLYYLNKRILGGLK